MQCFKNRLKIVFVNLIVFMVMGTPLAFAQSKAPSLIRDTEIETILKEWGAPIFRAANLKPEAINIILVQSDTINARPHCGRAFDPDARRVGACIL